MKLTIVKASTLSLLILLFVIPTAFSESIEYEYDQAGRLLSVKQGFKLIIYTYDASGNILEQQIAADSDGDGIVDSIDVYPLISIGSLLDSDGDGAPNVCDQICLATGMQADTDTEDFVKRFYTQVLQRIADNTGLATWVSQLQSGAKTGADIAFGFIFSQEFLNRQLSDSDYLDVLYRAFFDREPDAGGKGAWANLLLDGVDRNTVLEGFTGSQEFSNLTDSFGIKPRRTPVELFVTRFYQQALQREPDTAGLQDWTEKLNNQTRTGADVANGFIFSQEFLNRQLGNAEFVTILYRAFFGREPDSGGQATWIAQLDIGTSRLDVLNGFLGAQEFITLAASFGIQAN